jgi:LEA14-like dessication related protein
MITFKLLKHLLGIVLFGLCLSCKTKEPPPAIPVSLPSPHINVPVREKNPAAWVSFDRVEAETVEHISLYFMLQVENPRSEASTMEIQDWHLHINDQKSNEGAALILDSPDRMVAPAASAQFPLRLDLDMAKLSLSEAEDVTEYQTELQVNLVFAFATGDSAETPIRTEAVFPRIREPEFTITAIAVSKGEPVNTRFRVSLQIDNPNRFPLDLSSFIYELYGDGDFWAEGEHNTPLHLPANSSLETQLFFLINFIDISRNLRDQIATLKGVHYRLIGETAVLTNIEYLPLFHTGFDVSGSQDMSE